MTDNLTYRNADGVLRPLEGCSLYQDKADRYWLWSEQIQQNLAYKIKGREDCLLAAIDSLLFIIQLRDERIAELQRVADLAQRFAEEAFPEDLT